jgi:conjugative relaxase-like TrwC/TraI family protein
VLSIATGHDVGYLTNAVAGGREGYYTGATAAGEPPGLWYGAGAEALGLAGQVDADLMEAVYTHLLDPRDAAAHSRATWGQAASLGTPHRAYKSAEEIYAAKLEAEPGAGPERRAELRAQAERSARQAVSFLDLTFSAPKSVTVLGVAFERAENDARAAGDCESAEAWAAHRRAVEDAMLAGSRAALDYLQDVAGYARAGYHGGGAGRWVDAHEWTVAQFLQHDSRDHDPQLHVHAAVLNRVRCADGIWRTLDSRAVHRHRGAAGAIAERVMEAHLAHTLGARFATRPDGKAREVLGVSQQVMELFSSRRRAITGKAAELVAAFEARFGGTGEDRLAGHVGDPGRQVPRGGNGGRAVGPVGGRGPHRAGRRPGRGGPHRAGDCPAGRSGRAVVVAGRGGAGAGWRGRQQANVDPLGPDAGRLGCPAGSPWRGPRPGPGPPGGTDGSGAGPGTAAHPAGAGRGPAGTVAPGVRPVGVRGAGGRAVRDRRAAGRRAGAAGGGGAPGRGGVQRGGGRGGGGPVRAGRAGVVRRPGRRAAGGAVLGGDGGGPLGGGRDR